MATMVELGTPVARELPRMRIDPLGNLDRIDVDELDEQEEAPLTPLTAAAAPAPRHFSCSPSQDTSAQPPRGDVGETQKRNARISSVLTELLLLLVILPGIILVLCMALGGIIAGMEGWTFWVGAQYIISLTCGLATPLGNANSAPIPSSHMGRIFAGLMGVWTLGITGVVSGWASNLETVSGTLRSVERCCTVVEKCCTPSGMPTRRRTWVRTLIQVSVVVFGVTPAVLTVFVLLLGCILAAVESWPWQDGALYLLADVAGLPDPLVSVAPTSATGKLFTVVVSLWMFMFGGLAIGIASSIELPELVLKCGNEKVEFTEEQKV